MRLIAWTKTVRGWTANVRGLVLDIVPAGDLWVLEIDGGRSSATGTLPVVMRRAGKAFAFMGQN